LLRFVIWRPICAQLLMILPRQAVRLPDNFDE